MKTAAIPHGAPVRRLLLGARSVLVPPGWRQASASEIVKPTAPVSGALVAKAVVSLEHASIAWASRPAIGDAKTEAELVARTLVAEVPGARSFASETFRFADGALGRRVTIRLAVESERPTIQTHVVRLEGRTCHHLIATVVGREHARCALELELILGSFGGVVARSD